MKREWESGELVSVDHGIDWVDELFVVHLFLPTVPFTAAIPMINLRLS